MPRFIFLQFSNIFLCHTTKLKCQKNNFFFFCWEAMLMHLNNHTAQQWVSDYKGKNLYRLFQCKKQIQISIKQLDCAEQPHSGWKPVFSAASASTSLSLSLLDLFLAKRVLDGWKRPVARHRNKPARMVAARQGRKNRKEISSKSNLGRLSSWGSPE